MKTKISALAYKGEWIDLLALLRQRPDMANLASEPKGYTPLHQAAWHGASLSVIGELLALGANPSIRTKNTVQTAREIAAEKHGNRPDLQFFLVERGRTPAQLMRKIVADQKELFGSYNGNHILCDRLIEAFGADICCQIESNFEDRLSVAFRAVTGVALTSGNAIPLNVGECFDMNATPDFWANRFLSAFRDCTVRAHTIPIEKQWATVSDLFDPVPDKWGLRGDLYLWLEMRSALNHVPIPPTKDFLAQIISSAFFVLTGEELTSRAEVHVHRFKRGGMSSGMVSGEFWNDQFIPLIQQRACWLQEAWGNNTLR